MPKLPVVKSRQSRVSGQPSQVAGALIPDNTQHSWRDDVEKVLKVLALRGVRSWHRSVDVTGGTLAMGGN